MRRLLPTFRLLALVALAGSSARCGGGESREEPAEPAATPTPAPALRVVALTDLQGYLEPCGCSQNMLGGIDRFAARVRALQAEAPTLFVAAGDLFFGPEAHGGPTAEDAARWRGETIRDVLGGLGLAAVAPGAEDLAHPAALAVLMEDAAFPLLGVAPEPGGADADDTEEGAPDVTLTPTSLATVGDRTIGILGVTPGAGDLPGAARAAAESLRAQGATLVVALVSGDRRLARDVLAASDAALVVQGGIGRADAMPPSREGSGWIVHGGRQGQGVLVADLHRPGAEGEATDLSAWSVEVDAASLDEEIASLTERLRGWEAEGRTGPAIDRQRARLAALEAERAGLAPPPFPAEGPAFEGRWIALGDDAPKDAAVGERLRTLDRRINAHNREAFAERRPPEVTAGRAGYVGSASCQSCHGEAYAWWQGTPHGRAYATLTELDKEFHLDCVGCHVTGYERPGGSTVTWNLEGALVNVGCETCHGPGSLHVRAPTAHALPAEAPESLCVSCHNEEHSTGFVYAGYSAMLRAPGHGLPSARAATDETAE
ncbi:MAG: multiheme c-type cytochrome [Myxococcota bacterium]